MLAVEVDRAQALLSLLNTVGKGNNVTDAEMQSVLDANGFFVD